MKWQTQTINKKFLRLLQDNYPNGVTNDKAYRLYYDECFTRIGKERIEQYYVQSGRITADEAYKWDTMMTMNVRNQLCTIAYHNILKRVQPGIYNWNPAYKDTEDFWRYVDSINQLVRLRREERKALMLEARIEAKRLTEETGERVNSYEVFRRYMEEGR